jgi:glutathione S-transferase
VDGNNTLAESGAILEYLVERYDTAHDFAPSPDTPERLRYRYWLHYAEGSAMPPLLLSLVFSRLKKAPMPFFVKPVARGIADKVMTTFVGPQVKLHLDYMESELGKSRWFAGEAFSAADIQMSFPLEAAAARYGLDDKPKLRGFLERIHARPAYQRALEQGGPFDLLS